MIAKIRLPAHIVNDRTEIVLLFLGREFLAVVENEALLPGRFFPLFGLRYRRNELGRAAKCKQLLRRLAVSIPNALQDKHTVNLGLDGRRTG